MPNRRIEYVFGPQKPSTGHSLGISALTSSIDVLMNPQSYGTLFSGGRDGRINAWSLSPNPTHSAKVNDIHTNWVNDIVVFNNDSVVSCSADTTVKLWNVKNNTVFTVGHHSDYAQCLTKANSQMVISGGLDNKIIGWNVQVGRPTFTFDVGHSIYTLSAPHETQIPHTVVSGSPDGVVQLWDVREGSCVTKYCSHTDSIRNVHVLDNDVIMSGSSDGTVKLWSLRSGRLIKTLRQFHSSVWSLAPSKAGFWAGDRDGNVYHSDQITDEPKIVMEHAVKDGGLIGLREDLVTGNLWISTPFAPDLRCINPRTKESIEVITGHSGLRKHRLLNDKMRALVADTNGRVSMVDLVGAKPLEFERHIPPNVDIDTALDEILEEVNTMDVLDNWCQVQVKTGQVCVTLDQRSINNAEVYLDDLLGHIAKITKTPFPTPHVSPQVTPFVSPVNSPFSSPQNSGFFRHGRIISPAVSRVTSTQSMSDLVKMEQNRQRKLGTGKGQANFYQPTDEDEETETTNGRFNKNRKPSDVKADEVEKSKAKSKSNNADETEEPADSQTNDDEIRINLGNFVLESLLRGVVDRLKQDYENIPEAPATITSLSRSVTPVVSASNTDNSDNNSGRPERKRDRFFSKFLRIGGKKDELSSPASSGSQEDSKSSNLSPEKQRQLAQHQQQNAVESQSFQESWSRAVADRSLQSADPDSPVTDVLSRRAKLIVTEIAPGGGTPTEIYSTTVGRLIHNNGEASKIESLLPGWVGDAVLLGKLNTRQPIKIGFAVEPVRPELPEFSNENVRLMAISMIRARKIMAYTVGQLQQKGVLSAEASNYLPEDLVSLSCQGNEITALTTLATIRTRIWRKSGDVNLTYDIKKRV